MDRLAEILANLAAFDTLSDIDLENLKLELKEAARQAREGELTAEISALIRQAAEQVGLVKTEQAERAAVAAQIVADADEAIAMLDEGEEPEVEETVEEPATAETDEAETEVEEPAVETAEEAETEDAPLAIAASNQPKAKAKKAVEPKRAVKVPARHQPRTNTRHVALKVSGETPGMPVGAQFPNPTDMNAALFDRWQRLRGAESPHKHHMATIDYRDLYPAEAILSGGDADEVTDKIMARVNQRREEMNGTLLASGGIPGPAEPNYTQITYGQTDRPVRDALPSFLAARGSIIFNQSPMLSDILLDTSSGAVGTVTAAADLAGATKDIQEITAPTSKTAIVEAETLRFSQGNFPDRFLPERTRAFMELGQVAFARHNDALRLADIKAGSTLYTDTPAKFGAYRDLKAAFFGQLQEMQDRIRDYKVPIRVIMPAYVPAMLAVDMSRQQPGDGTWSWTEDRMMADIQSWDEAVNVTFALDSIRGRLLTTPSGQSPRSAGFDADVEWSMFPEGAWVYLDGGQMDLGVIRDSVTSATNKFQTFFEAWEGLAQMVNLSFWNTSSLCADGVSQAAAAVNVCSPEGS